MLYCERNGLSAHLLSLGEGNFRGGNSSKILPTTSWGRSNENYYKGDCAIAFPNVTQKEEKKNYRKQTKKAKQK